MIKPPPRILLVDDDEAMLELYSEVLGRSGYQVETAEDGEAAWNELKPGSRPPDYYSLVITDNSMPKLSGVQMIQKLRAAGLKLPTILATGTPPKNPEPLQLAAILPKPFNMDRLLEAVEAVLRRPTSDIPAKKLREFAQLLLAYEMTSGTPGDAKRPAAFCVCEKLREPLGKLLGIGGFYSLMSRALALAGSETSWLMALKVEADGSLSGLEEAMAKLDPRKVASGEVALVAQLIGLLVTFIGPALTVPLLQDIWPKMDALNFKNFNEEK